MLVLQRKKHEDIIIGNDIYIKILSINKNTIRIGITAPKTISVHRREVYERINIKIKRQRNTVNYPSNEKILEKYQSNSYAIDRHF